MSDADQFERQLREFTDAVPEEVRRFRNAVAMEVVRGVVMMSPVISGRLKGNWNASGAGVQPADESITDVSGMATILRALEAIEAVERAFGVITISNSLRYARFVNDGTSRSRAVHMVERTILRVERAFGR